MMTETEVLQTRWIYRHSKTTLNQGLCTRKAYSITRNGPRNGAMDFDRGDRWALATLGAAVSCPDCGRRMVGHPVKGTYSEGIECNERCTGALGPSCECKCAGQNHGGGWS